MTEKYMVFVEGGNVPKVIHGAKGSASVEAERLAKAYPNKTVRVLRVITEMIGEVSVKCVDYD